jgi:hypothetical protein
VVQPPNEKPYIPPAQQPTPATRGAPAVVQGVG